MKERLQCSLKKVITHHYIKEYQSLHSPGNAEDDDLSFTPWLEEAPAEDRDRWLHRKMCHVRQKIL